MTERIERLLAEAIETQRPVLVNPSEDEIRRAAEELRLAGRLICTSCRKPISDELFLTRRINFGRRLQAVAHLHATCATAFAAALDSREEH